MSLKWSHFHLPNGAAQWPRCTNYRWATQWERKSETMRRRVSQHEKAKAFGALLLARTLWEASAPLTAVVYVCSPAGRGEYASELFCHRPLFIFLYFECGSRTGTVTLELGERIKGPTLMPLHGHRTHLLDIHNAWKWSFKKIKREVDVEN